MRELKENTEWSNDRNAANSIIKEDIYWYLDTAFVIGSDVIQENGKWYFTDEFLNEKWEKEINRMENMHLFNKYSEIDIIKGLLNKTIDEAFVKEWLNYNGE